MAKGFKKKNLVLFLSLQPDMQELHLTERHQCEISKNSKKHPVFLCKFWNFHTRELPAHEAHRGKGGSSAPNCYESQPEPAVEWLTHNDDCQSLLTTIIFKTYVNLYKYLSVVYNLKHTV